MKTETLLNGLTYAEAPRWYNGKLWFSDMHGYKVMSMDASGSATLVVRVEKRPSGLGFLPDGSLLIVSMEDKRLLRFANGSVTTHADLADHANGEPNDMVVDRRGYAYVGSSGHVPGGHMGSAPSNLVLVTPDGKVRIAAKDMGMPNGICITPDGKKMIVAETTARRLTSFRIAEDGSLSDKRTFAKIEGGAPDGICLDADGGLWVGLPNGDKFIRVVEGGKVTHEIPTPGKMAVAAVHGGSDRKTLYLLTALREEPDIKTRRKSWISSVQVDIPGTGWP